MVSLYVLAILCQAKPVFDFEARHGLKVKINGIPVVANSLIQYYEGDWAQGYYGSTYDETPGKQIDSETYEQLLNGDNGLVTGTVTYHRELDHLKVHYDLHWGGDKPAKIELSAGWISAQVMESGTLTFGGKPTRSLKSSDYLPIPGISERSYGPPANELSFDSPLAKVNIKASIPLTLFDARGYAEEFAKHNSVLWLGDLGLDVSKDKPVVFDLDWQFQPKPVPPSNVATLRWMPEATKSVIIPDDRPPLILPKPTHNELRYDKPLKWTGTYDFPAGHVRFWESDFLKDLSARFDLPTKKQKTSIHIDGGVSKLGFHAGGYQITITDNSISLLGEEDEGLHNALRRLAELAVPYQGGVAFPTGYLSSNPRISWRGVHLFVGPNARAFHQKLWDRVLLPLGFNKVVLQCERTQWDCMPNMKDVPEMMRKEDLAGIFADYRKIGVEPIPLIQSFGHMQWFFAKNQNLDLAENPQVPYAIDPRKPEAVAKIQAIWDEACDLLKPSTIHFGCDEVNLLGFPKDDTGLVTDLWTRQMPNLKAIADKHEAQMMIWGDMALAPGEAIDATNGVSAQEAAKRRAAIPKGTIIGDWHYKSEHKIEPYLPSFEIWRKEGFKPIASAWYKPENVRGMDLAADVEKSGTLQTTWCGYTIDENTLLENWEQFSAMVLAGDYSWSTHYDSIEKLGYDPATVLRNMYFREQRPVVPQPGLVAYQGTNARELVSGDVHFRIGEPIVLRTLLSAPTAPTSVDLAIDGKGRHIALVLDATDRCSDGELLGQLTFHFKAGRPDIKQPIRYGREVLTAGDTNSMPLADRSEGYSIIRITLPGVQELQSIQIESLDPQGGLRLFGAAIW